jgi:hypothetical protein
MRRLDLSDPCAQAEAACAGVLLVDDELEFESEPLEVLLVDDDEEDDEESVEDEESAVAFDLSPARLSVR